MELLPRMAQSLCLYVGLEHSCHLTLNKENFPFWNIFYRDSIKIIYRLRSGELKDGNRKGLEFLSWVNQWSSHLHFLLTSSKKKVRQSSISWCPHHHTTTRPPDSDQWSISSLRSDWRCVCCRRAMAGTGNGCQSGGGRGRSWELPRWATSLSRSYK